MYKKKNRKPLFFTIAALVLIILIAFGLPAFLKYRSAGNVAETESEIETETEIPIYEAMIHKTDAGRIEIDSSLLKEDTDTETRLSIRPGTLVTLTVTPKKQKLLDSVQIVDAQDFTHTIQSIISDASDSSYNVDFSMPENDIIINFRFKDKETDPEPILFTTEAAHETEPETEKTPYGLTLHGITADLIMEFNGQFDDRAFLQQLGDALHMDSVRSGYYKVTDVTFSNEAYTGEKDSDKVYKYIYFNEDPDWKVLATYYLRDDAYVFTEPAIEPVTQETQPETINQTANNCGYSSQMGAGTSTYTSGTSGSLGGYSGGGQTVSTTTTTFDIMEVSTTFLSFVGGQEKFYDGAFQYLLSKGLTGNIIGTMSSYEIDPKNQTATFRITLNTGGSINGTYSKKKDNYSFSGL